MPPIYNLAAQRLCQTTGERIYCTRTAAPFEAERAQAEPEHKELFFCG